MRTNRPSKEKRDARRSAKAYLESETRDYERALNVVQDESLDEAVKIDRLAEARGWFAGDTTTIDRYMCGELSAAQAVEIIAKPIDDAYSSADFGKKFYTAEMFARVQRKWLAWHNPQQALEMWGPEQDFLEPGPDDEGRASGSAEDLLWELYTALYHAAKRIPYKDEAQQEKLVELVRVLKSRPDPPPPELMTAPLKRDRIWAPGTLWSTLNGISLASAEVRNDFCGCGAGWLPTEQHAWQNLTAFMARLTASGLYNLTNIATSQVLDLTERSPSPYFRKYFAPPNEEIHQYNVIVASLWVSIAAEYLFDDYPEIRDERDIEVIDRVLDLRDSQLPWNRSRKKYKNRARWETARREFARRRFEVESHNENLPLDVRDLAARAAKAMDPIVSPRGNEEST